MLLMLTTGMRRGHHEQHTKDGRIDHSADIE